MTPYIESYEWDEAKNAANRLKHGVGFELILRFDWSAAVLEIDSRYAYGEERVRAFGRCDGHAICVAFTQRGTRLRIISMRRMHDKEARHYGI